MLSDFVDNGIVLAEVIGDVPLVYPGDEVIDIYLERLRRAGRSTFMGALAL